MALHFAAKPKPNADKGLRLAKIENQREIDKLGLVYPCGLFHLAYPLVLRETGLTRLQGAALKSLRHRLLEAPLRQLRGRHQGLADTLSAVLGFGDDGNCDPEQVSRVATAVLLANLRVSELWGG